MDGCGIGIIPNAVNLFRGDVNLPLELISLPGRGDLDPTFSSPLYVVI